MLWIKVITVLFSLTGIYSVKAQINDVNMAKQIIIVILLQFWRCFAFICVRNLTASNHKTVRRRHHIWQGQRIEGFGSPTPVWMLVRVERPGKSAGVSCPWLDKQRHCARVKQEDEPACSKERDSHFNFSDKMDVFYL